MEDSREQVWLLHAIESHHLGVGGSGEGRAAAQRVSHIDAAWYVQPPVVEACMEIYPPSLPP